MKKYAKLPSLSLLRSFEAAARHESYTMAAEELGVTQGAVSRQIHELEHAVGAPLFRRVGRAVRLTESGRTFYLDLATDLDNLQGSVDRAIAAGEGASLMTIAVLPTFASRWLVPRLPDFRHKHPDIELSFQSFPEPFDLSEKRVDLAIHYGRADWPGARLTPLCPENLVAVASPELIEKHDITNPEDIFRAPLLHLTSRPDLWPRYRVQLGLESQSATSGTRFDQFAMIISAASTSFGVAILPTYLIEQELGSGQLISLGSVNGTDGESYFIATPVGLKNETARSFSLWMKQQVRAI